MVRGLLSDEEWAFFAPYVIEQGPKRGRPPADHRRVLDAVFWIGRTGSGAYHACISITEPDRPFRRF